MAGAAQGQQQQLLLQATLAQQLQQAASKASRNANDDNNYRYHTLSCNFHYRFLLHQICSILI